MNYSKLLAMTGAIASTAAVLFVVAPPAFAKAPIVVTAPLPESVVSRHISYADLNLASLPGEQALKSRVAGAVSDLCSEVTGGRDGSLSNNMASMRCDDSAWSQARPQISQAVQRAHEIASTGTSLIAATAITFVIPK